MPKSDEADDKKKKAPPAKGGVVEEPKSIYSKAWVDFSNLKEPGKTEVVA